MIFALHNRIDAKCCTYARQFFRRTTWRGAFFGGGLCTAPSEVSETISKVSSRGSSCVGLTGSRVPGWGLNDIIIHVVNNLSIRNKYVRTTFLAFLEESEKARVSFSGVHNCSHQ